MQWLIGAPIHPRNDAAHLANVKHWLRATHVTVIALRTPCFLEREMLTQWIVYLLIPPLVAAVAVASERFGSRIGGSIASLPLITGITLVAIATDTDVVAIRSIASHALIGGFAALALMWVYARLCARHSVSASTLFSVCAFLAIGALLSPVSSRILALDAHSFAWFGCVALIATISVALAMRKKYWPYDGMACAARSALSLKSRIALRIVVGTLFAYAIISANSFFGAALAGTLLALPLIALPQMVIEHSLNGSSSARDFIRGRNRCQGVQVAFFAVLCLSINEMSVALAFITAFAISASSFAALWFSGAAMARRSA
jgi:hypothetical protein